MIEEYKKTAYKVSAFTAIMCFLRIPAAFAVNLLCLLGGDTLSADALYICNIALSLLFLQILPSVISAAMLGFFRRGRIKALYRVPERCVKAVGNFPAVYGLGMIVNLLTIVIMTVISSDPDLNSSLNPITSLTAPSMGSAAALFVFASIVAPVFEEFVFRGTLLQTLKPYGNGLAILYTAVLFGLFHGNLSQCFYATAIGLALGYIANATDSLLPTTIIHILINSLAGGILVFLSTPAIQEFMLSGGAEEIHEEQLPVLTAFMLYCIFVLAFAFAGIILAVIKIVKIRRYRPPKVFDEITNGKKVKILLCNIPAVIAMLLLLDTFFGFSADIIETIFTGG